MEARWETQRGDEWWYSDHVLGADGCLIHVSSEPAFSISVRFRDRRNLSANMLLGFLRRTHGQFPDFQVWCGLDSVTEPLPKDLSERGQFQWVHIQHPVGRDARILNFDSADNE